MSNPSRGGAYFRGKPLVVAASDSPHVGRVESQGVDHLPSVMAVQSAAIASLLDDNPMYHRAGSTVYEDDAPFFGLQHGNLFTGAGSALGASTLADAIKNVHKRCGWVPLYLIVPPTLMLRAAQILNSTTCEWTANTDAPTDDRRAPTPILRLIVCRELRSRDAWAVALSLETDSANPDVWVKCAGQ